jgi:YtxH-like protein
LPRRSQLGIDLRRRVCGCILYNTRVSFIIPQKWIFAYNNFVRRIFDTKAQRARRFFYGEIKENAMRRMFGFMIGIVAGALIGSAVALLLAPETGDKFRSEIRARGEVLINDVRHAATARRIELTEQLESMRAPRADS